MFFFSNYIKYARLIPLLVIERVASTPTISDVSGKYQNTDFNSTTPTGQQYRLAPPTQNNRSGSNSPTIEPHKRHNNEKSSKHHRTETVKMWIMKGIVQVRSPHAILNLKRETSLAISALIILALVLYKCI